MAVLICLGPAPVDAHHGFQTEFDSRKPVTLDGVVTKIVHDYVPRHIVVLLCPPWICGRIGSSRVERKERSFTVAT